MQTIKNIAYKDDKIIIKVLTKEPIGKKITGTRIIQDKDNIILQKL